LPPEWAEPQAQGSMAPLASQIVAAHVTQGGRLAVLCEEWSRSGRSVRRLD